jgi:hypothetical protein
MGSQIKNNFYRLVLVFSLMGFLFAPLSFSFAAGFPTDNGLFNPGWGQLQSQLGGALFQQAYIKASNPGTPYEFGENVALSGDTLVVGSPRECSDATGVDGDQNNNNAPNSGAVYVFVKDGSTWVQQAYIKASNTDGWDYFGSSVAISGDTLAVGAPFEKSISRDDQADNSAYGAGAVYVFQRSGQTWSQVAYIKAPVPRDNVQFGRSVAIDDGLLVVGAPIENVEVQNLGLLEEAGAVYSFSAADGWAPPPGPIVAYDPDPFDRFGHAVALSNKTLVVGVPFEDSDASGVNGDSNNNDREGSGAVYVYEQQNDTTWQKKAYLKASNPGVDDQFGWDVAISGATIVVGARRHDPVVGGSMVQDGGGAYVFQQENNAWAQQAYLIAAFPDSDAQFGRAVAISGDLFLVGAPFEDSAATGLNGDQQNQDAEDAGAAYLFEWEGAIWTQTAYLKASNTDAADEFGRAVAITGSMLVAGAHQEDSNASGVNGDQDNNDFTNSGAVYVFDSAVFGKISPQDAQVDVSVTPTLSWGSSNGATRYEYCYDTTNDDVCSSWISNGTSTSKNLSALNPGTTYYWHVRAINSGGTTYADGSSTAFWRFTTAVNPPGNFDKTGPSNGAINVSTSPIISWDSSSGATSYEYCYDTTAKSGRCRTVIPG